METLNLNEMNEIMGGVDVPVVPQEMSDDERASVRRNAPYTNKFVDVEEPSIT